MDDTRTVGAPAPAVGDVVPVYVLRLTQPSGDVRATTLDPSRVWGVITLIRDRCASSWSASKAEAVLCIGDLEIVVAAVDDALPGPLLPRVGEYVTAPHGDRHLVWSNVVSRAMFTLCGRSLSHRWGWGDETLSGSAADCETCRVAFEAGR